jgi:hypothetical protein
MPMTNTGFLFEADPSKSPPLERAMAWLAWLLARGPAPVMVVEEMARQHGQSWDMVEEAKAALDIELVKLPPRYEWSWQISGRIKVPDDDPLGSPCALRPKNAF